MAVLRALGMTALVAGGLAGDAGAHGRPAYTNGVHFRPGDAQSLYVATTFGLLVSHDDGCTFYWLCEQNLAYSDTFDPQYAIAADGTIFATTFDGLRVSRDGGCSFTTATSDKPEGDPNRIAGVSVDTVDIGPTGEVWAATAQAGLANDVYRSLDTGATFEPRGLRSTVTQWTSVRVAAADAKRVWVAGHDTAGRLMRSDDAGATWTAVAASGLVYGPAPIARLAAVSPADRDVLLVVASEANGPGGDKLYRSADGGATFREALAVPETITDVLFRDADHVLATTQQGHVYASADGGVTVQRLDATPQLICAGQRSDGKLFGCGPNWDPDFMAVASSTDGTSWREVWRFVNMAGPLKCPAGTAEHDVCEVVGWPMIETNFAPTGPVCGPEAKPAPDAGAPEPGHGGCCEAERGPGSALVLAICVGVVLLRRRR